MAKENLTISSPDITGLDTLYQTYKSLPGNESKTKDQFYSFLNMESVERKSFLEQYCSYEYLRLGKVVVLSVKPK